MSIVWLSIPYCRTLRLGKSVSGHEDSTSVKTQEINSPIHLSQPNMFKSLLATINNANENIYLNTNPSDKPKKVFVSKYAWVKTFSIRQHFKLHHASVPLDTTIMFRFPLAAKKHNSVTKLQYELGLYRILWAYIKHFLLHRLKDTHTNE